MCRGVIGLVVERRIALVTGEYPPTVGGVGDYSALLAAGLQRDGAAVMVMTGRSGGTVAGEVEVRRVVPDWGVRGWGALRGVVGEVGAGVVHLQYQAGAFGGRVGVHLLPRFLRVSLRPAPRVVVTFHDLLVPYLFPKAGGLRGRAIKQLARDCDAVIATNGDDWRRLRDEFGVGGRLHLIPIGSNIPALGAEGRAEAVAGVRAALGVNVDRPLLAYFGLVSASKGVDVLLDALGRGEGQRAQLVLVGGEDSDTDRAFESEGDLRAAIAARGLGERVTVTGALPEERVAAYLAAADGIVLPYRDGASWRRGSLLAALTAGVPVITTVPQPGYDAGGHLPSLRSGESALLVPPGDAEALAEGIDRVLGDAPLRAKIVDGARALAEAFDWATIARRHLELYRALG